MDWESLLQKALEVGSQVNWLWWLLLLGVAYFLLDYKPKPKCTCTCPSCGAQCQVRGDIPHDQHVHSLAPRAFLQRHHFWKDRDERAKTDTEL